ncbi:malto-oligosyltrehalose trehalohydrolase [Bordetella genomosp. 13]|uniref:Malto-oligosyltrehalose trehalohydrolase n=1 Tax=Bordetella genomosp. 13 TaxID=463040 RepID=A0A1W6ZA69_9BORD|nr:malto-oligosyltrehalose trehalohydrolase [Bordetella genomosp. 13]ARP94135.1 malto-oligosyltrehalose trehalohydrolase [Bordetella genomosp. 13]
MSEPASLLTTPGSLGAQRVGAWVLPDGQTRFRIWAPSAPPGFALEIEGMDPIPMKPGPDGYAQVTVRCAPSARYRYRLNDGLAVPDPASHMQDDDVHGHSIVLPGGGYPWRHPDWLGRPWEESVIYEVHVGLAGGFVALAERLPELAELGFTTIELMPIADFPGERNWGYDGVLPYAPDRAYGTPEDLKYLVDTAHGLRMSVLLDVVYNHFGPDGNYLPLYAPEFFRDDLKTPWGSAIDFRRPQVRRFFQDNALYWLTEFRFDGLRLDAVHAIEDEGWLPELARNIRRVVPPPRHVHLVVENEDNDADLLHAGYDAQWNDDAHHVLHHMLTGERHGYYQDYADDAAGKLARSLGSGFVYQGEVSPRRGEPRGQDSSGLPPTSFVNFLQNHDQIGNRGWGERLTALDSVDPAALRAAVAALLLAPQIPLVFMGEECGTRAPFLYFTSHSDPELARAVREGRRAEFPAFAGSDANPVPDPNDPETYRSSQPWFVDEQDASHAAAWRDYYRSLLQVRSRLVTPRLLGARTQGAAALGHCAVRATWRMNDAAMLTLYVNLDARDSQTLLAAQRPSPGATLVFENTPGAADALQAGDLRPATTVCMIEESDG